MTDSRLLAIFNAPPEQAVEYLRSKGLQVSNSWRELWQSAHRRAFTVARTAGFDVLADIREALLESMSNNESYQQFTDKLTPVLQAKGWWGKAIDPETGEITTYPGTSRAIEYGSPRRLKLIYEQNAQTALMAGRWRELKAATLTHPYWRYVAVMDNRTRPAHSVMHGRVFRHDDAVWEVAYPPNGWRCRCRAQPLSASAVQRNGYMVESAEGYVAEVNVPQRDGSSISVKSITLPGMTRPFQPDAGWDYNPAADYHAGDAP